MSRKRKQGRSKRRQKTPTELIIEQRSSALLQAEREFWRHQQALRGQHRQLADAFSVAEADVIPPDLSSTVWGLRDGAVFVRHSTQGPKSGVKFRAWDITLQQWGQEGMMVPVEKGEVSLARAGVIRGAQNVTFVRCRVDSIEIPYVEFRHMKYGDEDNIPSVESAVRDFQLTLLGLLVEGGGLQASTRPGPVDSRATIAKLDEIADQFQNLLEGESQEEHLQKFLKENPFILHPSADAIPKQKLGEDFVTDFVLVAPLEQGPVYYLVELERAKSPILVKDGSLSNEATHALKQTRDWDIWLEKNKAYLQGRLPGFETPNYMIVMGRATGLADSQKELLRSYNRSFANTVLLTYDDVLTQFRATVDRLRNV